MSTIAEKLALANEKVPSVYDAGKSCKEMTDFSYFFYDGARSELIDCINTRRGINFESMFDSYSDLTTMPSIDTSNGTNFNSMFRSCLNLYIMSELDTSKGQDLSFMFYGCKSLLSIDYVFDLSSAINVASMFQSCAQIVRVPALDLTTCINTSNMFRACKCLIELKLIGMDTGNKSNLDYMFYDCNNLTTIDGTIDVSNSSSLNDTFHGCVSLVEVSFKPECIICNISFSSSSKLSASSLQSIVYGLKTGAGKTLTLHSDAWETLEASTPPDGYETWKEYITNYKGCFYA